MSKYIKLEDAIERLEYSIHMANTGYFSFAVMMNMLRGEFADLPTIEVSEDCISREWVKGICEDMIDEEMLGHMLGYIEDAPSVIPKPKEGEWILECDAEGEGENLYRCSECGRNCGCQEYDLPNFCPNCGAKMKG